MTAPERLVILDVDHTLLHSYAVETILDWLPPEDTNRSIDVREKYRTTLLDQVKGAWEWNDFVVCPRPHLSRLENFILSEPKLSVAFYSTAAPVYLETVLPRLVPKLYDKALFVWGKDKCVRDKVVKIPVKDMVPVCELVKMGIEQIWMVDDLPTVTPWFNRLDISPFNISHGLEPAHQDYQLLRLIKRMQKLLDRNKGIHSLRVQEIHQQKNWENLRNHWLTLNQRKGLTESDYPIQKPLPYDHVPDTREAVKDLLLVIKSRTTEELPQAIFDAITRPMTQAEYDAGGIRTIDIEDD